MSIFVSSDLEVNNPTGCAICSVRTVVAGRTVRPQMGRGCLLFAEVSQGMDGNLILEFIRLVDEQPASKQRGGRGVRTVA